MIVSWFYYAFLILLFVFLIPILVLLGIVIVCTTGFPVLFKQRRIGHNNRPFTIYKFRTMEVGAEIKQRMLVKKNEAKGPVFKIYHDPRFTFIGKFLSHTGLDELPQIWNVFEGDMSLIGPRPLPVAEAKKLKPWQHERHQVKPGILSPWVLNGYHSNSFDEWMKSDIAYARQKSIAGDIALFCSAIIFWLHLLLKQLSEAVTVRIHSKNTFRDNGS